MTGLTLASARTIAAALACIGTVKEAAEYLASWRSYAVGGTLSDAVVVTLRPMRDGRVRPSLPWIWRYPNVLAGPVVMTLAAVAGLALIWSGADRRGSTVALGACLLLVLLVRSTVMLRNGHAFDGGDIMMQVVLLGLGIACISSGLAARAALAFVGAQFVLAYLVAGLSKLLTAAWRNGDALRMAMRSHYFGHRRIYLLLSRSRALRLALSWSVITLECLGPLLLFLDPHTAYAFAVAAVAMHVSIAVFMGLNAFLFSFPAAVVVAVAVTGPVRLWVRG